MTVICEKCRTANRDRAMFCRGCAGKLPAFVATAPAGTATTAGTTRSASAADGPAMRANGGTMPGRSIPRWWFAAIVLLGAAVAAMAGWVALVPGHTDAAVTAPARAAQATPSPSPSPSPSSAVPFESALAPGESAVAVGPVTSPAVEAPVADAAPRADAVSTPATHTAPTGRAAAPRAAGNGRADPRAGCEHLFFAFAARCEANHCNESAYARHPRCEVVRAERQRDDARRNMTSGY
jgi:hypothetical protein